MQRNAILHIIRAQPPVNKPAIANLFAALFPNKGTVTGTLGLPTALIRLEELLLLVILHALILLDVNVVAAN